MVLAVASSGRHGIYGLGRRTNLRPGSACCKHSVWHRTLAEARGWGVGKGMGGRAGGRGCAWRWDALRSHGAGDARAEVGNGLGGEGTSGTRRE